MGQHLAAPEVAACGLLPPQRILHAIEEVPGLNIDEVADRTDLSRSATRYHTRRLIQEHHIVVQRQGNHRLHFVAAVPRMRRRAIAMLRVRSLRAIVAVLMRPADRGGTADRFSIADVADRTGLSLCSVYRGVQALEQAGLLETAPAPGRGAHRLAIHPELRIAWVLYAKDAAQAPRPLRAAPAWMLGFDLLLGKLAVGGWAVS